MNALIFLFLIGLLVLDACHTQTFAPPPQPEWQLPNDEKEEVAPDRHTIEQPQEAAPKKLNEHERLKLLEGQIDWMKKRVGDDR